MPDDPFILRLQQAGISPLLQEKWLALQSILTRLGPAVVAYSGGVDSGFLAFAAYQSLGKEMLAVTMQSDLDPPEQLAAARHFAGEAGFPHRILSFHALDYPAIRLNPSDRCYHCKRAILTRLHELCEAEGFTIVIEGQNLDDESDYRPGRRAVRETGTRSPLVEAGLTKNEIRQLAKAFGLSLWDKPASPCLATRFPYGEALTTEGLLRVSQAEAFLRSLGLSILRVRSREGLAVIEVLPQDFAVIAENHAAISGAFQRFGFKSVSLDLLGYRQGSLNEGLIP